MENKKRRAIKKSKNYVLATLILKSRECSNIRNDKGELIVNNIK